MKSEPVPLLTPSQLQELALARMPFGKYKGHLLTALPDAYLLWLRDHANVRGKLGNQLEWMREIKNNGLLHLLRPLQGGREPPHPSR